MSYTALYAIAPDGTFADWAEFRNAHGWASFIWDSLVGKYNVAGLRADDTSYVDPDAMSFGPYADWGYLWHLHSQGRLDLRPWEHNVLAATYDMHMVKAEDFETYAKSLELFNDAHDIPNRVNHTAAVAAEVRKIIDKGAATGLCFYPMSVGDDLWYEYDRETEEEVPYDFSKGTKHRVTEMRAL